MITFVAVILAGSIVGITLLIGGMRDEWNAIKSINLSNLLPIAVLLFIMALAIQALIELAP